METYSLCCHMAQNINGFRFIQAANDSFVSSKKPYKRMVRKLLRVAKELKPMPKAIAILIKRAKVNLSYKIMFGLFNHLLDVRNPSVEVVSVIKETERFIKYNAKDAYIMKLVA